METSLWRWPVSRSHVLPLQSELLLMLDPWGLRNHESERWYSFIDLHRLDWTRFSEKQESERDWEREREEVGGERKESKPISQDLRPSSLLPALNWPHHSQLSSREKSRLFFCFSGFWKTSASPFDVFFILRNKKKDMPHFDKTLMSLVT